MGESEKQEIKDISCFFFLARRNGRSLRGGSLVSAYSSLTVFPLGISPLQLQKHSVGSQQSSEQQNAWRV